MVQRLSIQKDKSKYLPSQNVKNLFLEKLNTILRIGNNGNVDNFSSGGMYTFVNDLGTVYVPAIDEKGNIYYKHPSSGCDIVGFKVPRYNELENFISTLSKVVPSIRYVGWDVVLNDKGEFIVIEGNQYPGVFQVKPSISGCLLYTSPSPRDQA